LILDFRDTYILNDTNERIKTLKISPWIKDRISLISLGFYKHLLFSSIKKYEGLFVTRLKGNVNRITHLMNLYPG